MVGRHWEEMGRRLNTLAGLLAKKMFCDVYCKPIADLLQNY